MGRPRTRSGTPEARLTRLLLATFLLGVAACRATPDAAERPEGPGATTRWSVLGSWSGRGDRQTESFDVTTGSLRLAWRSEGRLRVALHSAISGRPLETVADVQSAGADTVRFAVEPHVAYLLIEADRSGWSITLEEGAPARAD